MIFNMSGGNGGAVLNFKVVGSTTKPVSPKENTIWINTDTNITDWMFSATQPENSTEGDVWLCTSITSLAQFNSVKQNDFTVYLLYAKQYIGGVWETKETSIYQNGAWVELWDGVLYKNGNTYDDITGGWQYVADTTWSNVWGTAELNDDHMFMNCGNSDSGAWYVARGFRTAELIDVTNFGTLCTKGYVTYANHASDHTTGGLEISICDSSDETIAEFSCDSANTDFNAVIDVSNLTGKYYVKVVAYTWTSNDVEWLHAEGTISEIYLI